MHLLPLDIPLMIEEILLGKTCVSSEIGRRDTASVILLHNSFYPYVDRECIGFAKAKKQGAGCDLRADTLNFAKLFFRLGKWEREHAVKVYLAALYLARGIVKV